MNDDSRRGHGARRRWPRRAAALAAMACMVLLATACGSGSSPRASATGGPTREQRALAYAQCMRSHGVPDFPDPDSNGDFNLGSNQAGGGSKRSGSNSGSSQGNSGSSQGNSVTPQERSADHVCHHLLNGSHEMSQSQQQHVMSQLVRYAQCMRAHGVPNFPDPEITNGGIGVPSGFGFNMPPGLDEGSPQFQSANQACESIARNAKGGGQ
jgi:hypothetical protein